MLGLLGENGAGKTTSINIMCGLLQPTSGTVLIGGYDITIDKSKARQMIGVCPQADILFDNMTVEEHLLFYGRLRGIPFMQEKEHCKRIIEQVGLEESKRRVSKALSGGMKRRLSIAIALVGDPLVVFLEYVTALYLH